jgi:Zn-dependent metalloprotease
MKNSILYIGIALIALSNISNAANLVDKQTNSFQEEILGEYSFLNRAEALKFNLANQDTTSLEVIESANTNKMEKTTDELFAEDNAITENNISNETLALNFEIISRNLINNEVVESVNSSKIEKTPEELIAEDNAITENNLSNETQALDFGKINRNSNLVMSKNKSIRGYRLKL